jgi:hypothetical protein
MAGRVARECDALSRKGATVKTHRQMLDTYPKDLGEIDRDKFAGCIDACFEGAQACNRLRRRVPERRHGP